MDIVSRSQIVQSYRQRIAEGKRNKLSRQELSELIQFFIDALKSLKQESDIQALCAAEMELLQEGYSISTLAGDYIPLYREAIATAIDSGELPNIGHTYSYTEVNTGIQRQRTEHYALTYLKYDKHTYTNIRQESVQRNAKRMDALQVLAVHRFINRAVQLLFSAEPEELAIALCALTGRRHTEIVVKGSFSLVPEHGYVLYFEGQQKKKGEPESYHILTLIPASQILEHFERFRQMDEVKELAGLSHSAPAVRAFHTRVNTRVKRTFGDIVPCPEGFDEVTIHRLRGCYGAIAIHFFCPEMKDEGRFLQQYLGHELGSSATQHYRHYRLVDDRDRLLKARGVKIPAHGLPPFPGKTTLTPEASTDTTDTFVASEVTPSFNEETSEPIDPTIQALTQQITQLQKELKKTQQERDKAYSILAKLKRIFQ